MSAFRSCRKLSRIALRSNLRDFSRRAALGINECQLAISHVHPNIGRIKILVVVGDRDDCDTRRLKIRQDNPVEFLTEMWVLIGSPFVRIATQISGALGSEYPSGASSSKAPLQWARKQKLICPLRGGSVILAQPGESLFVYWGI